MLLNLIVCIWAPAIHICKVSIVHNGYIVYSRLFYFYTYSFINVIICLGRRKSEQVTITDKPLPVCKIIDSKEYVIWMKLSVTAYFELSL